MAGRPLTPPAPVASVSRAPAGPGERRAVLRDRIAAADVDAMLVTALPNIRYLSGFSGSSGLLLLGPEPRDLFLTDFRYKTQVDAELDPEIEVRIVSEDIMSVARAALLERGVARVAFERAQLSYKAWAEWSESDGPALVPVVEWVEETRAIKSEVEVNAIRRACRIADETFEFMLDAVRPGVSERELAGRIELELVRRGAEGASFETIVAFGERSALPHARPTGRELARGELVLFDFGAVADGYVSDMTRTVACGDPPAEMIEIYEVVLAAQMAALEGIRAGMAGPEADALARAVIDSAGHGPRFGHSLGHGIGLEVHEAPRLSRKSVDRLEAGMVVTVEPGVYVEGIGGVRIEDDALLGTDGLEALSAAPKDELLVL